MWETSNKFDVNKMKSIFLFLFILSFSNSIAQSTDFTLKEDTLFYIEFVVFRKSSHTIQMSALAKSVDFIDIEKSNIDNFIQSFYNKYIYVPDIFLSYQKIAFFYMNENENSPYTEFCLYEQAMMINRITDNISVMKSFSLNTGEIVKMRIMKIAGCFFIVPKQSDLIVRSSLEYNIDKIQGIEYAYMPFSIYYYKKFSKKEILHKNGSFY